MVTAPAAPGKEGAGFRPSAAVDQPGGENHGDAEEKVAKLPYVERAGRRELGEIFYKADGSAPYGTRSEGGKEGGKLGEVHFDERRDEGDGEFKELQDGGDGGENGGHAELAEAGVGFILR